MNKGSVGSVIFHRPFFWQALILARCCDLMCHMFYFRLIERLVRRTAEILHWSWELWSRQVYTNTTSRRADHETISIAVWISILGVYADEKSASDVDPGEAAHPSQVYCISFHFSRDFLIQNGVQFAIPHAHQQCLKAFLMATELAQAKSLACAETTCSRLTDLENNMESIVEDFRKRSQMKCLFVRLNFAYYLLPGGCEDIVLAVDHHVGLGLVC